MFTITIKETDYKVRFGMNSFIDTDIIDRAQKVLNLMNGKEISDDKDVAAAGMLKDLFDCTRELFFIGFKKYNPIDSPQTVGDLLDDYIDEGEDRGILSLFNMIAGDLFNEGFLADLLTEEEEPPKRTRKKKVD